MKRLLTVLFVLAGLAVFAATFWYLWQKANTPPVVYRTKSPAVTDIVKKTVATGSVVPRKEVLVKPQVSGIVESIAVEPGQTVQRGALLATIRVVPNTAALAAAESRVTQAALRAADAERDVQQQQRLFEDGLVAEREARQSRLAADTAREELAAARDNLEVIRKGISARAGNAGNTEVRATIDGTVLDVPIKEGTSVIEANTFNDGTTVASLADMDELIFEGKVDESEVGKLRPGMEIVLTIGALEPARFAAVLEYIAPKGVAENGAIQFQIRAALRDAGDALIRANYSANADIVLDRREQVLALEESLLQFEGDEVFVEVETAPQQFARRKLRTGLSDGVLIEVLEGLGKDDRVKAGPEEPAAPKG